MIDIYEKDKELNTKICGEGENRGNVGVLSGKGGFLNEIDVVLVDNK